MPSLSTGVSDADTRETVLVRTRDRRMYWPLIRALCLRIAMDALDHITDHNVFISTSRALCHKCSPAT